MMVERDEKKHLLVIKLFTTFFYNYLSKAIRILDNKKVFYKESKKYSRDRALARTFSL